MKIKVTGRIISKIFTIGLVGLHANTGMAIGLAAIFKCSLMTSLFFAPEFFFNVDGSHAANSLHFTDGYSQNTHVRSFVKSTHFKLPTTMAWENLNKKQRMSLKTIIRATELLNMEQTYEQQLRDLDKRTKELFVNMGWSPADLIYNMLPVSERIGTYDVTIENGECVTPSKNCETI